MFASLTWNRIKMTSTGVTGMNSTKAAQVLVDTHCMSNESSKRYHLVALQRLSDIKRLRRRLGPEEQSEHDQSAYLDDRQGLSVWMDFHLLMPDFFCERTVQKSHKMHSAVPDFARNRSLHIFTFELICCSMSACHFLAPACIGLPAAWMHALARKHAA